MLNSPPNGRSESREGWIFIGNGRGNVVNLKKHTPSQRYFKPDGGVQLVVWMISISGGASPPAVVRQTISGHNFIAMCQQRNNDDPNVCMRAAARRRSAGSSWLRVLLVAFPQPIRLIADSSASFPPTPTVGSERKPLQVTHRMWTVFFDLFPCHAPLI